MPSFLRAKRLLWGVIFGLVTVTGWVSFASGRHYVRAEAWVEHTLEAHSSLDARQLRLLELHRAEAARAQVRAIWAIGLGAALTISLSLLSLISVHRDVETLRRATEDQRPTRPRRGRPSPERHRRHARWPSSIARGNARSFSRSA